MPPAASPRRALLLAFAFALAAPAPVAADSYIMGAGNWTCGEVLRVANEGSEAELGQLIGWVLGFWSAMTYDHGEAFTDIVEDVGGRAVFDTTLMACSEADPGAPLHAISISIVRNTE